MDIRFYNREIFDKPINLRDGDSMAVTYDITKDEVHTTVTLDYGLWGINVDILQRLTALESSGSAENCLYHVYSELGAGEKAQYYRAAVRLERRGFLESRWEGKRRYYHVTPRGKDALNGL